jgi:putative transposase
LGLAKSTWHYAQSKERYEERYSHLREPLMEIARQHPEYGYRRTTSELADLGYAVNHKVIQRLHRHWHLSVIRRVRPPKPNPIRKLLKEAGSKINLVSHLKEIDDLEVFYTDFTEIIYRRGLAKAQLMPIIDHRSKLVAGHALGEGADTDLALRAWRRAKATLKRFGRRIEDIIIHHDQDGVYTGHRWLYEVVVDSKARISYSEDGAKGNVHMEAFIGRFKDENRLIFWEQDDIEELEKLVNERIRYYNFIRRHSALGNKSPMKYLKEKGKLSF